ncbi:hypothetical protein [Snodgrassella sp.]|uniref:hypothetical protein n=1 Tax=Snodgrassella sp. TaxID=2815304 RepID=UPI0025826CA5|nr:hypothetical protein [Snodgrassella sp.]MCO6527056.1 hypothetical protein [Snodgrassella sp.]
MGWFVVDMVSTTLATEDNKQQKDFSIDEEFLLIHANSRRQLYRQIKKNVSLANGAGCAFFNSETRREINNDSSGAYERCWYGDGLGVCKVLGIRKILPLSWQSSRRNDKEIIPFEDGDLIMSSRYKVKSFDEVKRLLNGEVVKFIYLNDENINLAGNKKFKYLYLFNNENMDEL